MLLQPTKKSNSRIPPLKMMFLVLLVHCMLDQIHFKGECCFLIFCSGGAAASEIFKIQIFLQRPKKQHFPLVRPGRGMLQLSKSEIAILTKKFFNLLGIIHSLINIFENITYIDSLIVGELGNSVPLLRRASHCTHH